jgi:hypothetical protein
MTVGRQQTKTKVQIWTPAPRYPHTHTKTPDESLKTVRAEMVARFCADRVYPSLLSKVHTTEARTPIPIMA